MSFIEFHTIIKYAQFINETSFSGVKVHEAPSLFIFSNYGKISKIFKKILLAQIKCIVLKPSHIQGFLDNSKIERDISISLRKKWSWTPCRTKYKTKFIINIKEKYHSSPWCKGFTSIQLVVNTLENNKQFYWRWTHSNPTWSQDVST